MVHEDLSATLLEFLESPHVTTEELLADTEMVPLTLSLTHPHRDKPFPSKFVWFLKGHASEDHQIIFKSYTQYLLLVFLGNKHTLVTTHPSKS